MHGSIIAKRVPKLNILDGVSFRLLFGKKCKKVIGFFFPFFFFFPKSSSIKLVCELSILGVRIANFGLLKEPIRILLSNRT